VIRATIRSTTSTGSSSSRSAPTSALGSRATMCRIIGTMTSGWVPVFLSGDHFCPVLLGLWMELTWVACDRIRCFQSMTSAAVLVGTIEGTDETSCWARGLVQRAVSGCDRSSLLWFGLQIVDFDNLLPRPFPRLALAIIKQPPNMRTHQPALEHVVHLAIEKPEPPRLQAVPVHAL
jgi:hypothetical protein